jgi:hypothetical protein
MFVLKYKGTEKVWGDRIVQFWIRHLQVKKKQTFSTHIARMCSITFERIQPNIAQAGHGRPGCNCFVYRFVIFFPEMPLPISRNQPHEGTSRVKEPAS